VHRLLALDARVEVALLSAAEETFVARVDPTEDLCAADTAVDLLVLGLYEARLLHQIENVIVRASHALAAQIEVALARRRAPVINLVLTVEILLSGVKSTVAAVAVHFVYVRFWFSAFVSSQVKTLVADDSSAPIDFPGLCP
jgi:hypothetical protein